jgi:membrane protein implicated in regulation of membrane protease activity
LSVTPVGFTLAAAISAQETAMFHWFSDILASATTTLTFFTIFLVGVVFSAFTLILGGHSDHADHDIGHDIGHDTDVSHDGHDASGDHADGDAGAHPLNVGLLSVRGVALLSTGFGGIGFLMFATTQQLVVSTVTALIGGYIFAFAVLYTLKVFKGQQANSLINTSSAVGSHGIVTVSIPADGLGEVTVSIGGVEMFKPARSANHAAIRSGTRVQVQQISGGTLVVTASEVTSSSAGVSKV